MPAPTKPPSGTRDFLPADVRRREAVVAVIRRVYESYGFEPLETPAMERLEVLLGKYGEEGDQLLFEVLKRGESFDAAFAGQATEAPPEGRGASAARRRALADFALRYDLTVPLARVVAEHQARIPKVFKRYQIQPVWRADRPQKGRFREFFQCDLDAAGSASRLVEVEVASAASEALRALGFADFRIRTNHRGVLAGMVEAAGVPADLEHQVFVALDKLDKIGRDGVTAELRTRGIAEESVARLAPFLDPAEGGSEAEVARLRTFLAGSRRGAEALADLEAFLRLAEGSPAASHLRVDPSLARGLDYYTGPIFEVAVADLSGSIGSGGRYDGLVGSFLGREVPACGFSLGLERILVVLDERGQLGAPASCADVTVGRFDEDGASDTLALARELRAAGLRVDVHCDADKIGKQYKDADARGVPCVALVGPDERTRGTVSLKHLKSGERAEVPRSEAAAWVRERLQR